jgi:predicted transcriptional regulator
VDITMAKSQIQSVLKDADKEIMELMWSHSESGLTIHEILQIVNDKRNELEKPILKFPTLRSILERLSANGNISKSKHAREVKYSAALHREEYAVIAMDRISREFFGMEFSRLVPHLSSESIDEESEINKILDVIKKKAEM